MSDRITSEFMPTTLEAFGATDSVRRGKEAEDLYYEWAKGFYDKVENHESDQEKQNQGIDFTIHKIKWKNDGYTVDVKSSIFKKQIKVDNTPNGWLRNPKKISNRIVHVDVKTGAAVEYRREEMIDFIDNKTDISPSKTVVEIDIYNEKLPKRFLFKTNLLVASAKSYTIK